MIIKIDKLIETPLYDKRVNSNCYYVQIKIKDYLNIVDLEANIYQRSLLKSKLYKKLIEDILEGAVFPTISVVYPSIININDGLNTECKLQILDGLQRTNCLIICKGILNGEFTEFDKSKLKILYKNEEEFLNRLITLELWEQLSLQSVLYKIVVLNTGQRRMDTKHQLDILMYSLQKTLIADGIDVIRQKEKEEQQIEFAETYKENKYPLSDIAESLVSYIAKSPTYTSQTAADYLFENLNLSEKEFDNVLDVIEKEQTYKDLIWVLKDLGNEILKKYNENVLIKYGIFLIGLMAALGFARVKREKELVDKKLELLLERFTKSDDPLSLSEFEEFYRKFTSGIGAKRRKLIYTTFKNYLSSKIDDELYWKEAFKEIMGE